MVIAAVVASALVISAVFPAITRSSNSIVRIAQTVDDRIQTQISVVYGAAELDENAAWQDTDSDTYFDVWLWVKNVGAARILGADQTDIFFGTEGNFERVPHANDAGGGYPQWTYAIENGTEWTSTTTAKITIHYSTTLASDTYTAKVVTPSGAYDSYFFSFLVMGVAIAIAFALASLVVGVGLISNGSLGSIDNLADSRKHEEVRKGDQSRTALSLTTSSEASPLVNFTVKNSGQRAIADFPSWDVVVKYYDTGRPVSGGLASLYDGCFSRRQPMDGDRDLCERPHSVHGDLSAQHPGSGRGGNHPSAVEPGGQGPQRPTLPLSAHLMGCL